MRSGLRPAVFLDRDGTLNRELAGYVRGPEELQVFPCAGRALALLVQRGVPLFLASNQAGVGKGLMTQADLDAVDARLRQELERQGVRLEQSYYCTHTEEQGCDCRKPKPGLLLRAARDHGLDLSRSFMVGDSWRDMAAGRAAGARTVFVPTGIDPAGQSGRVGDLADYLASDLEDAVRWICERMDENGQE